jgi:hypothetical protein
MKITVGWKVVGPVVKELLAADLAAIGHLEEARNIRPLPQQGQRPRNPRTTGDASSGEA